MAGSKQDESLNFHLSLMEQTGFGMNIPEGFKPIKDYGFRVLLESIVNDEKKCIIVTNRIDVRTNTDTPVLGYVSAKYWFGIAGFDEHIKKDKKGSYSLPVQLQLAINAIALSTTRGLLFAAFRGTILHNAILPVIDPAQFQGNEIKR